MSFDQQIQFQPDCGTAGGKLESRRRYRKPSLEKLGELRTLTLGGSPGIGDSGAGSFVEFPPADRPPVPFPPPGGDNLMP